MSPPRKALILAAGTGSRLMPLTADRPKALVPVGERCLLERLIDHCERCEMEQVVVVTGHLREVIEDWLKAHRPRVEVVTVFNEQYATLNNAHSVWVARDALAGAGFIKFDGDLVLHEGILDRLLGCPDPSALTVDRSARLDEEAMKAAIDDDGRVTALGKWLATDDSAGESIGLEKIAAADAPTFFAAIEQLVHREGHGDAYYEDVYHALLQRKGWALGAADTAGLPWAEVDDHRDLQAAVKQFG